MKIGVIADTHIPVNADTIPKKVLEAFKGVDIIIHAGDLVDLSVIDTLKNACKEVIAVAGNMDSQKIKTKLPEKKIIKIGNYKIGVMHGYGHPNSLIELTTKIFKNDNVNIIIFGHSHTALNEKKGDILYFNPGSPTDTIFAAYNSYGILEINDKIEGKIIKL